jgi:hypothetical protein
VPTPLGAAVVVAAKASRPRPPGIVESRSRAPAPSQPLGEKQVMVRVVFPCTLGSPLQNVGRIHTQDAELASSAKLLETHIGEDMTRRPLPDVDYCVFAHRTCSHRSTPTHVGSWVRSDAAR